MQYYTPFEKLDKNNNADFPVLVNGKKGSQAYLKVIHYLMVIKNGIKNIVQVMLYLM